jgi:hypothetical protein
VGSGLYKLTTNMPKILKMHGSLTLACKFFTILAVNVTGGDDWVLNKMVRST